MKKKIPKRDIKFQKSIMSIDDTWTKINEIDLYSDDMIPQKEKERKYKVNFWKCQTYYVQRWLCYSLTMAYTNQHKNVHDKFSRLAMKSYHLYFGFALLPACWDKLAQFLRCFFEITWTKKRDVQGKEVEEDQEKDTCFQKIVNYLKNQPKNGQDSSQREKTIETIDKYWGDQNRKDAYDLANRIKHRVPPEYFGIPLKTPGELREEIEQGIFNLGRNPVDERNLYNDISLLKTANNSFVKCAMEIDKVIDYNQFYTFKNGKKTLCID